MADQTHITLRADVLAAFGVTEADMAAMDAIEAANGYTAAKADAEQQHRAFRVWATAKQAELRAEVLGDGGKNRAPLEP